MSDGYRGVRSYQRIFSPERRIHQIEGRPLPVPGGVPLRRLGWALGALLAVLVLGSGSLLVPAVAAAAAGAGGLTIGDRTAGLLAAAAAAAAAGCIVLGVLLAALDWPIRFVVLPIAVAAVATQATPDGRRPERYAASWLALRLAPRRRSLGRGLPAPDARRSFAPRLWVGSDGSGAGIRPARVTGPAVVCFFSPFVVRRSLRGGLLASPPGRLTRRSRLRRKVELRAGETLRVRP